MNVLLGVEGSDESMKTLHATIKRTLEAGDTLTVAVLENDGVKRSQAEMSEEVHDCLEEAGLEADVRLLSGDPGSELVTVAEREAFDQVVIGGGEASPMGKIRLGPITEFVLLNSPTTVTLVR